MTLVINGERSDESPHCTSVMYHCIIGLPIYKVTCNFLDSDGGEWHSRSMTMSLCQIIFPSRTEAPWSGHLPGLRVRGNWGGRNGGHDDDWNFVIYFLSLHESSPLNFYFYYLYSPYKLVLSQVTNDEWTENGVDDDDDFKFIRHENLLLGYIHNWQLLNGTVCIQIWHTQCQHPLPFASFVFKSALLLDMTWQIFKKSYLFH